MIKINKDKLGIWTSLVCIIHCLVVPLFATVLPTFFDGPTEYTLLILAALFGSISFLDNFIKHKYFLSLFLFLGGFLFIFTSKLIDNEFLNIIGLVILMAAHYFNYLKVRSLDGCHPHGCKH